MLSISKILNQVIKDEIHYALQRKSFRWNRFVSGQSLGAKFADYKYLIDHKVIMAILYQNRPVTRDRAAPYANAFVHQAVARTTIYCFARSYNTSGSFSACNDIKTQTAPRSAVVIPLYFGSFVGTCLVLINYLRSGGKACRKASH